MQKKIMHSLVIISMLFLSHGYVFAQSNLLVDTQECLSFKTPLLRVGSKDIYTSLEVTQLQKFLISKGLLLSEATGYYGKLTFSAVKAYQSTSGITPTGNVGPLTKAFIQKQACKNSQGLESSTLHAVTPTSTSLSGTSPLPITPPQAVTQTVTFYKANKASNTCMATTMITTLGGAYEYKVDEYKSEGECLNSFTSQALGVCTAEYRSCPDGSPMLRDPNCTWRADKCPSINIVTSTSVITSATLMRDQKTKAWIVHLTGSSLGDFNKLEYSAGGITGYVEQGLLSQNGTVRDLPADLYLSTPSFSTFQLRIIANDGSKGTWITASVSR